MASVQTVNSGNCINESGTEALSQSLLALSWQGPTTFFGGESLCKTDVDANFATAKLYNYSPAAKLYCMFFDINPIICLLHNDFREVLLAVFYNV